MIETIEGKLGGHYSEESGCETAEVKAERLFAQKGVKL